MRYILAIALLLALPALGSTSALTIGNTVFYSTFQPITAGANCIISNNYTFSCAGGGGGNSTSYTAGNLIVPSLLANGIISVNAPVNARAAPGAYDPGNGILFGHNGLITSNSNVTLTYTSACG